MNEVNPGLIQTWIWISMFFFIVNIALFASLIFLVFMLIKWMKEMKPKIDAISTRVESIGQNVEEISVHVKATAETVGGRAKSVATSVDSIAHMASTTFEKFSPLVVGALTAMRLVKAYGEMRRGMTPAQATSKKALENGRAKRAKTGKA